MNCPKCALPLLQKRVKEQPTDVDYCQQCNGIWFDDGEVSATLGVPARNLGAPANARPSTLQCPRCAKPLVVFPYPGTMVLIDRCRTCRGVWLDGGEAQQLAKSRPETPVEDPAPSGPSPGTGGEPQVDGVKGQLIRFIDRSIESLWAGLRR